MVQTLSDLSESTLSHATGARAPLAGIEPVRDDADGRALEVERFGVTRESTISMRVVRALIETLEQSGIPQERVLQAARLTHDQLHAPEGRLVRAEVYRLCELAVTLTGDPAFGLHWAEQLKESTFLPITNLIVHAANLRAGLESLRQFSRLISDEVRYDVIERGDEFIMCCQPLMGESLLLRRFLCEMMTVGFLRQVQHIDAHARPRRVSFEYAAPSYRDEYTRIFGQAVHFDQRFTGIVFDRALLSVHSPYRDDDMHEALRAMAEQRLMRIIHRTPYAVRVREILVRQGWPHRTDMKSVASVLGMSVRSLRRRLAAEDKAYADVLNEALAIVAKQLLRNDARTIEEVSSAMGFADKSTFYRSFKRWTGMTPNAYRQTEREKA